MSELSRNLRTIPEMEEEFEIPKSWWYERSRRGAIPGLRRLGRHIRVDREEFLAALREGKID